MPKGCCDCNGEESVRAVISFVAGGFFPKNWLVSGHRQVLIFIFLSDSAKKLQLHQEHGNF
jgi:hypothetical protein